MNHLKIIFRYVAWVYFDKKKKIPKLKEDLLDEELYDHRKESLEDYTHRETVNVAKRPEFKDVIVRLRDRFLKNNNFLVIVYSLYYFFLFIYKVIFILKKKYCYSARKSPCCCFKIIVTGAKTVYIIFLIFFSDYKKYISAFFIMYILLYYYDSIHIYNI